MVDDFILGYARLIVKHPNVLRIEKKPIDAEQEEIILYADSEDVGRLIGKDGKMISSIKAIISGCKAKGGKSYRLNVQAID